jgi:hypothetical protein
MKNNASTTFFESDEQRFFAAYVELRRRVFRECYPVLPADFGYPDETDRVSRFVYAEQGGLLCGGARLTISTPAHPRRLPLEEGSSRLQANDALRYLDLESRGYAEISRMAVDPACSDGLAISFGLGRELCRVAACHGIDTVFSICPPGPARLNRVNAGKCGVRFNIYPEWPTVFGIAMRLCAYTGIVAAYGNDQEDKLTCQS